MLVLALGFTYWQKEQAETRADTLAQRNATLQQTAEDNAKEAQRLVEQMEVTGRRLAERSRAAERLRGELRTTRAELSQAMEQGDEEVQECRGVSLPSAVVDRLREHARAGDRVEGQDGNRQ